MSQFRILQNRVCNKLFDQAARVISACRLLDVVIDKWIVGKLARDIARRRTELSAAEPSYRINFLCQGNICRSVYAQYALQERLYGDGHLLPIPMQETQLDGRNHGEIRPEVLSCGTATRAGKPAEPLATDVAKGFGIDLSQHAATCANEDVITESDLIFFMDAEQFFWLLRMWWRLKWFDFLRKYWQRAAGDSCPRSFRRSYTIAGAVVERTGPRKMPLFLPLGVFSLRGGYPVTIRDPYGKDRDFFVRCFQQINCALDELLGALHSSVRSDVSQK